MKTHRHLQQPLTHAHAMFVITRSLLYFFYDTRRYCFIALSHSPSFSPSRRRGFILYDDRIVIFMPFGWISKRYTGGNLYMQWKKKWPRGVCGRAEKCNIRVDGSKRPGWLANKCSFAAINFFRPRPSRAHFSASLIFPNSFRPTFLEHGKIFLIYARWFFRPRGSRPVNVI